MLLSSAFVRKLVEQKVVIISVSYVAYVYPYALVETRLHLASELVKNYCYHSNLFSVSITLVIFEKCLTCRVYVMYDDGRRLNFFLTVSLCAKFPWKLSTLLLLFCDKKYLLTKEPDFFLFLCYRTLCMNLLLLFEIVKYR